MPGDRAPVPSAAEIRRALGRILLFLGLFIGLLWFGSLFLPAVFDKTGAGLLAGSALTLVAAVTAGMLPLTRLDRRPPGALGFAWNRDALRESARGLAIGLVAIAVAALLMAVTGGLGFHAAPGSPAGWLKQAAWGFALLAVAAAAEEALFRGYAFQWLARAAGPVAATIVASGVFAAAHLQNPNADAFAVLNIFLAGVLLSVAYLRTRSLWFATAVHLGWNWGMASLLDLPVSGLEILDAPLYEPVIGGPQWLTGGAFGPEAGLAGTVAFVVALVAVLRLPGIETSRSMRALGPIVDPEPMNAS